ncbi:hypothetical protein [Psychroflexus sp. ALD_RP9]|uniref:hypothetical protein n=1 Tax=Psychroflexus sp. ALD_RP9 TaxID=2777186 RepID=UPI001A8F57F5|nr:hypothetical protein [Psychroflexus sp. ALD_RP9]QSS96578.1 hypothetical protein IMZ30_09005 [Psychroflexus sp. ALD_RP9]
MEATFKRTKDGLKLTIEPRKDQDRNLVKEFLNQELPGYKHSLEYSYDDKSDAISLQFVPIINKANLLKEGFTEGTPTHLLITPSELPGGFKYYKFYNKVAFVINHFGTFSHINHKGEEIKGQIRNIIELRNYLMENANIWKSIE